MGRSFLADLGFSVEWDAGGVFSRIEVAHQHLSAITGGIRPSVLATVADCIAGLLSTRAWLLRVALTVDLTMHCFHLPASGCVIASARILKAGRTLSVVETSFSLQGSERSIGVSHATFMASPRQIDVLDRLVASPARGCTMASAFADQIGVRLVEPGAVELDLAPQVLQSSGTIQGGAVALLVELAAESSGVVPTDLELHYLSSVRAGPARATAKPGNGGGRTVEVHDRGDSGRLVGVGFVQGRAERN